jgi:ribonuclease G
MSKELIISVNGREKKIALIDNGRVTEFYIERGEENSGVVGNIYKGRVQRVLPGMQSAFVEIGLERDAFLYVSDFFDEEEEIERIVMEKSKKTPPEEAKREAVDSIERARVAREKQMEAAQDIAEPLAESGMSAEPASLPVALEQEQREEPRRGRRGGRGRGKGKEREGGAFEAAQAEPVRESIPEAVPEMPIFEYEDSGFERVIDDEDTGEMFKDAYMQEAIVDKVRAVEFDIETTGSAAVGSILDEVGVAPNGFQRIADEDEAADDEAKPKSRGRGGKAKTTKKAESATAKKTTTKKAATTKRTSKKKASDDVVDAEPMPDAEASESEPSESSYMAVRRGGRGRRRGGRRHSEGKPEARFETSGTEEAGFQENEIV